LSILFSEIFSTSLWWVGELALWILPKGWHCVLGKTKCANVGWLKLFFKMCGGKIFKTNALALVSATG
jgi:hypothetical protein